jgi:SAM-dependent methyltransferase
MTTPSGEPPTLSARLWTLLRHAGDAALDRLAGIDTWREAPRAYLPKRSPYVPTNWVAMLALRRLLRSLPVTPDDTFVDFGSGKGRVLHLAAQFPFRRVIGVELDAELNRVARANIERHHGRYACREILVVDADAERYVIPDDVTVAYFYNPFRGAVFTGVVDRLCASVAAHPRALRVIYAHPLMHEELERRGFRVTRTARFSSRHHIHMYTYEPAAS